MFPIFPHIILGPEMAAPILWALGFFCSFCWKKKNHAHQIPRFRGGWAFFLEGGGGGSANSIFMGTGIF